MGDLCKVVKDAHPVKVVKGALCMVRTFNGKSCSGDRDKGRVLPYVMDSLAGFLISHPTSDTTGIASPPDTAGHSMSFYLPS